MATLTQTLANRQTAGARYTAALRELRSAYIDLGAIDGVLANGNSGLPSEQQPVKTFSRDIDALPTGLAHPEFAPAVGGNLNDAIRAARDVLLADFR